MNMTANEETDPAVFAYWLRFWRRVIAALEVIGGLGGIYVAAFGRLLGPSRVFLLFAFSVYVAALWAGVLLALGRRGGAALSLALQTLQLFQVSASSVVYSFVCGLQILLGGRPTDDGPFFGVSVYLPARFTVFLNPPPEAVPPGAFTGLNMTAVLSIICLLYVRAAERKSTSPAVTVPPKLEGVWPPAPEP